MGNYMSETKNLKKKDWVIKLHSQLSELLPGSRFSNFKDTCNCKAQLKLREVCQSNSPFLLIFFLITLEQWLAQNYHMGSLKNVFSHFF